MRGAAGAALEMPSGKTLILVMAKPKSLPSSGHRLPAALLSYQQGHAGVDRLLKQFDHVKIQPAWDVLAMRLLLDINRQVDADFDTAKVPKWVM